MIIFLMHCTFNCMPNNRIHVAYAYPHLIFERKYYYHCEFYIINIVQECVLNNSIWGWVADHFSGCSVHEE